MDILGSIHLWCFSWHCAVHNAMGNGNHSRYNMELLMIEPEVIGSKLWLIHFYQEQLDKFAKLGLGKYTEFYTKITKELIETTQRRLDMLTLVYDGKLTPQAHVLRRAIQRRKNREKLLNGSTNSNGTTKTQGGKDHSDIGHERSGS